MFDSILERATLEQFTNYVLYGTELRKGNLHVNLENHLDKSFKKLEDFINTYEKNPENSEKIMTEISYLLSVYEEVYMQIGIKVGSNFQSQLKEII